MHRHRNRIEPWLIRKTNHLRGQMSRRHISLVAEPDLDRDRRTFGRQSQLRSSFPFHFRPDKHALQIQNTDGMSHRSATKRNRG